MLHLCLGKPGEGKTFWLHSCKPEILVGCTNRSHRNILATAAAGLGIDAPRAHIDDLLSLILAHPPTTLGFDDIDRAPLKFNYSVMLLAEQHTVFATATDKRRIAPILERQAAILHTPTRIDHASVIRTQFPTLSPHSVREIAGLAKNHAGAVNLARQSLAGFTPQPATTNIGAWVGLFAVGIVFFVLRHILQQDAALIIAGLSSVGYVARYWLRRRISA